MSATRDNHYVPQWYQKDFFEGSQKSLKYLHLKPTLHAKRDGTKVAGRSLFDSHPAQCFYQTDLYSTFFGFHVSDEIERRLFGEIDRKGAEAVRAFKGRDVNNWIEHFEELFKFIDAQKLRTPKGLDWLRLHYPFLDQNQLMFAMQGVRMMHCTLWAEGVREIVSAEDSDIKFIISDHPVTVYNHAVPPEDPRCAYPNDPLIAWKASQTIYPLDQNFCLILSNLEYAQDPDLTDPCSKRTNARNFRQSLIRADAMIHSRSLNPDEVSQVNYVLKSRANRFIAAGREEWLYPERTVEPEWTKLRQVLLPPKDELWHFGGETYVSYTDGRVDYQDQFGRSEPRIDSLSTANEPRPSKPQHPCGCGSGKSFGGCCAPIPAELRPSWSERSIRERNIGHARAIMHILGINEGKDWAAARRDITDEKIRNIYGVFRTFWPLDTDLISLLPKPDGRLRALFTGLVDPRMIFEYAAGAANYFGEILIQNPFRHSGNMRPEFSPTDSPRQYRQEVLKSVSLLLELMPLIDAGVVNFFPDPCAFDHHLFRQMMEMAEARTSQLQMPVKDDLRARWLADDDYQRVMWSQSDDAQRAMIHKTMPERTPAEIEMMIEEVRRSRGDDYLAMLQADPYGHRDEGDEKTGLFMGLHMVPNFEISLFLAQATGSIIFTDTPYRWRELNFAAWAESERSPHALPNLKAAIEGAEHLYLVDPAEIMDLATAGHHDAYKALIRDACRYLTVTRPKAPKPNWEAQLPKRFTAAHTALQKAIRTGGGPALPGKVRCIIPTGGIRDNTINRLLLMSSVDHYLDFVPMAFFIERPDPSDYPRPFR